MTEVFLSAAQCGPGRSRAHFNNISPKRGHQGHVIRIILGIDRPDLLSRVMNPFHVFYQAFTVMYLYYEMFLGAF